MDTSYAETGSYLYVRIFSTAEKDIEKKIVWQIITTHQSAGKKQNEQISEIRSAVTKLLIFFCGGERIYAWIDALSSPYYPLKHPLFSSREQLANVQRITLGQVLLCPQATLIVGFGSYLGLLLGTKDFLHAFFGTPPKSRFSTKLPFSPRLVSSVPHISRNQKTYIRCRQFLTSVNLQPLKNYPRPTVKKNYKHCVK